MAALIVFALLLFCLCAFVWLGKLVVEVINALVFGVAGGVKLFGRIVWCALRWSALAALWLVRVANRYVWPALGRLFDWLCIHAALVYLRLAHWAHRAYVRSELNARGKDDYGL